MPAAIAVFHDDSSEAGFSPLDLGAMDAPIQSKEPSTVIIDNELPRGRPSSDCLSTARREDSPSKGGGPLQNAARWPPDGSEEEAVYASSASD